MFVHLLLQRLVDSVLNFNRNRYADPPPLLHSDLPLRFVFIKKTEGLCVKGQCQAWEPVIDLRKGKVHLRIVTHTC